MHEELVDRARGGDHAAFERLASESIDRLYAIARRVLREPTLAEDAVQECLVRAWRDLRALRDSTRWEAWTYRLLLNACRDEQRRARRRPMPVDIGSEPRGTEPDHALGVANRDELERGFQRLTVEHRMVLTLHFYAGYRLTEIADLLGVPEGTVNSRIHYGSRALRAALQAAPVAATTAGAGK
jgi:RNA polymerase sigma-70 factor (ECF subfamily)